MKLGETTIKACNCKHTYQDARYGPGMRVHNMCQGKGANGKDADFRCTVCSTKR